MAIDRDGVIREFVSGELNYRAFNQLAQLATGSLEEPDEEIAPVRGSSVDGIEVMRVPPEELLGLS